MDLSRFFNDNAYKVELLGNYGVSSTFNDSNLFPYEDDEPINLRMSPFQPRENDALGPSKSNENSANKSPLKSNFGVMIHEIFKAQNLIFYQPTIYLMFQLSMKLIRNIKIGHVSIFTS